ncbi:hemerythrin domain-containing protein [Lentzea sp. NPDC051208]|uniref:hemerythrin domain-containing protein n=1 Tax=Lentzea sp. NPDC051208 TaxID=3154642 RepID=UPI00343E7A23
MHDHLRRELADLRTMIADVVGGRADGGQARAMINGMSVRRHDWRAGAHCTAFCRTVTSHHMIEDNALFPRLRRVDPDIAPVLDQLEVEHHVIAAVLDRVDAALVAAATQPDGMAELQRSVDLLADVLLAHLAREERELAVPLGRLR